MKIVLSRKGCDTGKLSGNGVASPIFPDGRILSLPIPEPRKYHSLTRFQDLQWDGHSLAPIVECLSNGHLQGVDPCHLDPDLRADALPRMPGWRAAFGQVNGEQTHLAGTKRSAPAVGRGDLFLFFGLFRLVEKVRAGADAWKYVSDAPQVHRLFGWLQVSEVVSIGTDTARARAAHPWLSDHPHMADLDNGWSSNNTVYLSTPTLSIDGIDGIDVGGGGSFRQHNADHRLTLTEPEQIEQGRHCKCSYWRLPEWFWPADGHSLFSRSLNMRRRCESWVHVNRIGQGQEFVFDGIPKAIDWVRELFERE